MTDLLGKAHLERWMRELQPSASDVTRLGGLLVVGNFATRDLFSM